MARASLGWTIDVLAAKTFISSRTIKRIEASSGAYELQKLGEDNNGDAVWSHLHHR